MMPNDDVAVSPSMMNWYLGFAEWRLALRSSQARRSVKFFRQSHDHMIIWMALMRGYYSGHHPSCNDCIEMVRCSKETARKIIFAAQSKGYLELRPGVADSRKKLVYPSKQSVAEYEAWVDILLRMADEIDLCIENRKTG